MSDAPSNLTLRPWYAEPMVWLVISLPAAAVIAGIATAFIAMSGTDGPVAKDTVRTGLAVRTVETRGAHAAALGLEAEITGLFVEHALVRVRLRAKSALPDEPVLTLNGVHPGRAGLDQRIRLDRVDLSTDRLRAEYVGRALETAPVSQDIDWAWVLSSPTWRMATQSTDDRVGDVQAIKHPLNKGEAERRIVLRAAD